MKKLLAAALLMCVATAGARAAILYDQTGNPYSFAYSSQNFEPAYDTFDTFLADDFTVPLSGWTIDGITVRGTYTGNGPVTSFNVFVYGSDGTLPGAPVASYTGLPFTATSVGADQDFAIPLTASLPLAAGNYWVAVQANMYFDVGGQWFWFANTAQSGNAAAFSNPGNAFGTSCTAWGLMTTCVNAGAPDLVFRLTGEAKGPSVPEPATPLLLGAALASLAAFRRRLRRSQDEVEAPNAAAT